MGIRIVTLRSYCDGLWHAWYVRHDLVSRWGQHVKASAALVDRKSEMYCRKPQIRSVRPNCNGLEGASSPGQQWTAAMRSQALCLEVNGLCMGRRVTAAILKRGEVSCGY